MVFASDDTNARVESLESVGSPTSLANSKKQTFRVTSTVIETLGGIKQTTSEHSKLNTNM